MKKLEKMLGEATLVSSGPVARAVSDYLEKNEDAPFQDVARELVAAVGLGAGLAARRSKRADALKRFRDEMTAWFMSLKPGVEI